MLKRIVKFFTSLRLTVVCLGFAVVLVFFGTLAQVNEGLYLAQSRWFRSFFVWWGPEGAGWKMPIFPGGYLIGGVLLINLIAAHIARFQVTWKKFGIHLAHAGIILLLLGQLATDLLSRESQVQFVEGQTKQYSESARNDELVFITDSAKPNEDQVVSVPGAFVKDRREISNENLPFTVRVKEYYPNADIRRRGPMVDTGPPPATEGIGAQLAIEPAPESRDPDKRNLPTAVIELSGAKGLLGTWLVCPLLDPQEIKIGDKIWRVALRWQRNYLPYSMKLLKTTYEVYPGTDTPKNFQSRVRIENPVRGENREVNIYMNNPLRYEGLTFYQFQMGRQQLDADRPSTLMVVRNPGWLTPYIGCLMVGGGLVFQFMLHLVGFISKRRIA